MTVSAPIADDPGSEGPPVWIVETIPCVRAHSTIGAAAAPVRTDPSPISPSRLTPPAAISAMSSSVRPSSRIGAPPWTFTPPGPERGIGLRGKDRERLEAVTSFGRPGTWTSPAETAPVTPPWSIES